MDCSRQSECLDRGPASRSKLGKFREACLFGEPHPISLHVSKAIHRAHTRTLPGHSDP